MNDFQIKAALETIEENAFAPQEFFSTRDREAPVKISDKILIDLESENVTPVSIVLTDNPEHIFHPNVRLNTI